MKLIDLHEQAQVDSYDQLIEMCVTKCQPFLSQIGENPVWRGMTVDKNQFVYQQRERRQPLNTADDEHTLFNKAFVEKFGVPYRDKTFGTGDWQQADNYTGKLNKDVVIMLPIGEFSFCWSETLDDLWQLSTRREFVQYRMGKMKKEELYNNHITKIVDTYQTTDLKRAIDSRNEIMFDCPNGYIALSVFNIKTTGNDVPQHVVWGDIKNAIK